MASNEAAAEFPTLSKRTCPMCGEPVKLSATKCAACGEALDDAVSKRKAKVTGIGGWLILPAIGAVISPPFYLFVGGGLLLVAASGAGAPGGARAMVGLAGMLFAALGLFSIYVAVMFFQKKRSAPKLMIARFVADIGINWMLTAVTVATAAGNAAESAGELGDAVRSTIVGGIWIAYFAQSERVKNTFVN
jgi:hypothetical protein